jgi:hypothetical protein
MTGLQWHPYNYNYVITYEEVMKKLALYILPAILFWTLPALAINLGQQTAQGTAEAGKAVASPNLTDKANTPTKPATALLLGAGLIGLVAFSRDRAEE